MVVAGALTYGTGRLQTAPAGGPEITVGLVAIDEPITAQTPAATRAAIWQQYAQYVAALAAQGACVLVLPEK